MDLVDRDDILINATCMFGDNPMCMGTIGVFGEEDNNYRNFMDMFERKVNADADINWCARRRI